ncbi:molybdopterin-dependent oxidoreductase [Streptomyces sp. NPDC091292]|uniref:molybdopterin-dependent oxidoreductase n=1 Tax=Streptomyces sp. NPDC091292 TaxID=3365991 RepID=UPI00382183D0
MGAAGSTGTAGSAGSAEANRFTVTGAVAHPVRLTVAELRTSWPQHTADVVFDCATSGPRKHRFAGPLLREVVTAAGPAFDPRRRKDRSRFLLEITGGDGHGTVLSWAEVDEDFGNAPVLLATSLDGRELDIAGAQLVVPWDRCGARYISGITRVWLGTCPGRWPVTPSPTPPPTPPPPAPTTPPPTPPRST